MSRTKSINKDLPDRLFARKGKKATTYYYVVDKQWINLGKDKNDALKKWADLESGKNIEPNTFQEIAAIYFNEVVPNKAPATQKDNDRELIMLNKVFGSVPISQIHPHHIKKYLLARKAKVRANREKALLSHIYNFARESGYTNNPNPCAGIKGNKEVGRDIYVEDDEYAALWHEARDELKDFLDLLLYTGQRPSDVRKMSKNDIKDNALWVMQGKTGKKLGIEITGEFKIIMDRIVCRYKQSQSIYLISNLSTGQAISKWTIRDWFNDARKKSGMDFQMRDLRAKNATDAENIELAKARLGHTTTNMTDKYTRNRKGKTVKPYK